MKMRKATSEIQDTTLFDTAPIQRIHRYPAIERKRPRLVVRFLALLLLFSILSISVPAAPETVLNGSKSAWQSARFAYLSGDYSNRLSSWFLALFVPRKRSDRRQSISEIRIVPEVDEVFAGQELVFSAIATDRNGETISGLKFEWSARDVDRSRDVRAFRDGKFRAMRTGTVVIKASANGIEGERQVTVVRPPDPRPRIERTRVISTRTGVISDTMSEPEQTEDGGDVRNGKGGPSADVLESVSQNTAPLIWDDSNWLSSDDPGNLPGNPPGSPMDDGAGNGNFQISAPVISLPGRGIDLALNLNYNSRVWNKAGSQLTFDIDRGMPNAPGWTLGFGKLVNMGSGGGCMLIDADGTRHGYTGTVSSWSSGFNFTGHAADGTFIDYGCSISNNYADSGWSKLPNGTSIYYSSIGSASTNTHLFPVQITDAQGNYINITYRNASTPQLDTITDTLGRIITFHYDSLDRLTHVKAPRMTDQGSQYGTDTTRELVRIHYRQLTLGYSFAGGITPLAPSTSWVIDSILYPATGTGYWFGGADPQHPDFGSFYSSYGMLTKVEEHRGMSWTSGSETQGTISPGTMAKRAEYNYPLATTNASGRTNGVSLSDAPTYTELKESWDGMDVTGPAVTTYAINNNDWKHDGTTLSPARSVTVTQPTGVVSRQYSYRTPGTWTDGLVFTDETEVTNGSTPTIVSSSNVSWQQGNYDSPRPSSAEVTDENGHKLKTVYEYSTNKFNQITKSCDYDNANNKLRCAVAQYENSADYIGYFNTSGQYTSGRHIFNLVTSSRVENPNGTLASRTDYEYDNATLQDAPGVIQHLHTHNPHTLETQQGTNCLMWQPKDAGCTYEWQEVWVAGDLYLCQCEEYEMVSVFDWATLKRGNLTKVTGYTDAQAATGPVVETRSYDITGNLVKTSSSCCEETNIEYDDPATTSTYENYYAYPLFQTRGASSTSSPHRITTSAVYSFETGLVKEVTDANGLTSESWYNPDTLRPVKSVSSTGAFTEFSYDDSAMTVTEEVFEITTSGPLTAGKSKKYLNGVGQVRKEESSAPSSIIDIVETKYTLFGEEWKQSRPYRSGDTVQWSERFYDNQRRLIKVVEPDGSETKAFYNESGAPSSTTNAPGNKMRVVDAWGRERWGRYDQQERLVEVVEPNPDASLNSTGVLSASGNLLTKYTYDTLGRLIQTDQGLQVRKFKYDSLGRLTRQKLAEQTATLNDNGTHVTSGGIWSEAFFYDSRSNLTQKTDARGVKTLFSYDLAGGGGLDPLNRLHSRSYDTSGPLQSGVTVHYAPPVSYEYMTAGDKTRIKKIRTSGTLTEDYSYDAQARVSEYKQTVDYRESFPMTVNYLYDTLDRVKELTYPAQYQMSGNPRRIVAHTYDTASRLSTLTYNGTQHAGDIVYNASDQTTEIKIGAAGTNQVTEQYAFDPQTGLLTNQKAIRNSTELLNLSYEYNRGGSVGSLSGKTGHLTKIIDNLNTDKSREYEFDALGRLTKAKGGTTGTLWNQSYSYDRYGNRTNVTASGTAADSSPIPIDGVPNLTYDNYTNRITTSGYDYDVAGNQTTGFAADGTTSLTYEYDAANRVRVVRKDNNQTDVQAFVYGSTNARLIDYDAVGTGFNSFYCSVGGTVLADYTEIWGTFTWMKSYTYLGDTQLATVTPNGSGGETVEFNHPDRLGTRLKTNQSAGTSYEQAHLPFGIALNAESTLTTDKKRFTSYDRSPSTGLDYAINRTYDNKLGRFTQVDPIGMNAADLNRPQTLNLYSYCANDPINHVDPDGLFFGKLFKAIGKFFKKLFKWILVAVSVAIAVLTVAFAPVLFPSSLKLMFGIIGAIANAASSVLNAFGLRVAGAVLGVIAGFASLGTSFLAARSALTWTSFMGVVASGATAVSRTLSAFGYTKLGRIFGLVGSAAGFVANGLDVQGDKSRGYTYKWKSSAWDNYKFARNAAQQIATIAGANRVAGFLDTLGIVEDVKDLYSTARMTTSAILDAIKGPDDIYQLQFPKNSRRLLAGKDEDNARFYGYVIPGLLKIYERQFGRVNSIIRRVGVGAALAR